MYQAKIFENEESRVGNRCYGCSIHFHYTSQAFSPEALDGLKMVHSSITEMLANVRDRWGKSDPVANSLGSTSDFPFEAYSVLYVSIGSGVRCARMALVTLHRRGHHNTQGQRARW